MLGALYRAGAQQTTKGAPGESKLQALGHADRITEIAASVRKVQAICEEG